MRRETSVSTIENQQHRLDAIERGRAAAQAAAFLAIPIHEMREIIIKGLINTYRSGETAHDRLLGGIAEVAALDKLMNQLENAQTQGNIASQKEFGNG